MSQAIFVPHMIHHAGCGHAFSQPTYLAIEPLKKCGMRYCAAKRLYRTEENRMRTYVLALTLLAVPLQSAAEAKSYSSMLMNAAINHDLEKIRKDREKYLRMMESSDHAGPDRGNDKQPNARPQGSGTD
jgi:hypothetical protein